MNDRSIPADVIGLFCAVSLMLINDGIIAAIIGNMEFYLAVLAKKTTLGFIFSANQLIDIGYAIEIVVTWLTVGRHPGIIQSIGARHRLMIPLGSIAEPYIHFPRLGLPRIIDDTMPRRIRLGQTDIHTSVLVYVRLVRAFRASQCDHIAHHFHMTSAGFHIFHIHIDRTAIAGQRIIGFLIRAIRLSFIIRGDNTDGVT